MIITDSADFPKKAFPKEAGGATEDLVRKLYIAQEGRCSLCDDPMQPRPYRLKKAPLGYTEEHVFPKSKGGRRPNNVLLAHYPCNSAKSDRLPTREEAELLGRVYERVRGIR